MADKTSYITEPLNFDPVDPEIVAQRAQQFQLGIKSRRTVRHYSSRPVPREIIETCIKTAGNAPSDAN